MDSALYETCRGSPEKMEDLLRSIAQTVAYRNGVFVSIWHNHYLDGALVKEGSVLAWYLDFLKERGWHFWTMDRVARWWKARNTAELLYRDPDTWELIPRESIDELTLRSDGGVPERIEGLADGAWSVVREGRSSFLTLRGLRPANPVTIHRGATT